MKKDEKPKPTVQERIVKYLEAVPGAIEGAGGSTQTFKVACTLFNGWGLSEDETLAWLKVYNAKCEPRWSEKELKHKANDAAKAAHEKPRGYLLGAPTEDQRCEPDRALPTKPIASGQVQTTLTTANSYLAPNTRIPHSIPGLTRGSKSNVVNVVKPGDPLLVGPDGGQNAGKPPTVGTKPAEPSAAQFTEVAELAKLHKAGAIKNEHVVKRGTTPLVSPKDGENAEKSSVTDADHPAELSAAEHAEARRIAGELVKLRKAGAISGADDPEATFYSCLLRTFEATFEPK